MSFQALLGSSRASASTADEGIDTRSEKRIDGIIRFLLTLISVVLLLGPAAVLLFVKGQYGLKLLPSSFARWLFGPHATFQRTEEEWRS